MRAGYKGVASARRPLLPRETFFRSTRLSRPVDSSGVKRFEGPVTIEQSFKVDGRKLTVLVTFPAPVVAEVGMEALTLAANRAIVQLETKSHQVEKFR